MPVMAEPQDGSGSAGESCPTPEPIHLVIKTAKDKETIEIEADATIEEVSVSGE